MNILKRFLSSSQKSAKIQLKILDNPLSSIQSRPLAPYAVFVKENFALVGQQLSSKESPKIMAELGKRWKDLGDKDVYQKKAKEINENAKAQLDSALKRLGVFDFKIIQRRRALEKVLGRSPPKFRDESRPKSLSPHAIYFGKNYSQFKNEESPMKAAHEAYANLSKDEKQIYIDEAIEKKKELAEHNQRHKNELARAQKIIDDARKTAARVLKERK